MYEQKPVNKTAKLENLGEQDNVNIVPIIVESCGEILDKVLELIATLRL